MPNFITKLLKLRRPMQPTQPTHQSIKTAIPAASTPLIPPTTPKFKFDIAVFEIDDPTRDPERTTVISESAETLGALYATCNQRIKIISKTPVQPQSVAGGNFVAGDTPSITVGDIPPEYKQVPQEYQQVQQSSLPPVSLQTEPRYITVCGIKMKIVGDTVYQKQWIRASADEAKEFRVVSDKNNKLISLKDRHVEIEKWIKLED